MRPDDLPGPLRRVRKAAAPPEWPGFGTVEVALARVIRTAYIDGRSAWETMRRCAAFSWLPARFYDKGRRHRVDGEPSPESGKDVPPVWLTLAARFLALRIDPEEYLRFLFERDIRFTPPEPAQVLAAKYLAAWEKRSADEELLCRQALDAQVMRARLLVSDCQIDGMNFVASHAWVLTDPGAGLSALFRYCLARSLLGRGQVFRRIARVYRQRAAVQFQRSRREYLVTWKDWLPEDFVAGSRALYLESFVGVDWDVEETRE